MSKPNVRSSSAAFSDLLRRLSPRDTSLNLNRITTLVPDLTEELLASVDQPLDVRRCAKSGRDYLLCDYNRDGDSHRSPWSNEFDPPMKDGIVPSERIRKLEVAANEAFDVYRGLYYEGGVGSTYFWDLDDGFAGVVLLKKGAHILPIYGFLRIGNAVMRLEHYTDYLQLFRRVPKVRRHGTASMSSKQAKGHELRSISLQVRSSCTLPMRPMHWGR